MSDYNDIATRYAAVWNEPDADLRRAVIAELFAPDAAHYTPSNAWRGHAELEVRVAEAHEKFVKPGGYVFRSAGNAEAHHDGLRFNWEMATTGTGEAVSVGFDFMLLDEEGRIVSDHQFLDR